MKRNEKSKRPPIEVSWSDQSWPVGIERRRSENCFRAFERLVRPEPKEIPFLFGRKPNLAQPSSICMKPFNYPPRRAFTLVELLVVIAIIAILASLLLPAIVGAKTKAKIAQTKTEMANLAVAVRTYENDYSRNPMPAKLAEDEAAKANADFTYGDKDLLDTPQRILNGYNYEANNSQLMKILLDFGDSVPTNPNRDHIRNPRKVRYFDPKQVSDESPGLSTKDYVLRDPWGKPYIITLDMNDDNKCRDAMYKLGVVSNGAGIGLVQADPNNNNSYELSGPIMIWSFGPDRGYDINIGAKAGVNKDNVLSW